MAITVGVPNTVHLGGPAVSVNDLHAGVAITPGMLIEMYSDSGTLKFRPHASADEQPSLAVADNQSMQNKLITDVYAVGDLVEALYLVPGSKFFAIIPSGQDIAVGGLLQSNGDGKLKAAAATTAAANVARFQNTGAASGAVVADTRIRVQVIC